MPRRTRICLPGLPVHVIQRGNNKQSCFNAEADRIAYAHWLGEGAEKFEVLVHGWVFMSNHVHLLLTPGTETSISRLMQFLGRLYVRHYNHAQSRTGTLFEGRYRSCPIQDETYLINCLRYIELNPVRAGLVSDPAAYRWSSYQAHAEGVHVSMWTPHALYLALGRNAKMRQEEYRLLIRESLGNSVVTQIRHCINKGLVLGSDRFREEVLRRTGEASRVENLL